MLKRLLEYLDALDEAAALIRSKAADEKCYPVQEQVTMNEGACERMRTIAMG